MGHRGRATHAWMLGREAADSFKVLFVDMPSE